MKLYTPLQCDAKLDCLYTSAKYIWHTNHFIEKNYNRFDYDYE